MVLPSGLLGAAHGELGGISLNGALVATVYAEAYMTV
jgi:hypothetical protein